MQSYAGIQLQAFELFYIIPHKCTLNALKVELNLFLFDNFYITVLHQ